MNRSVRIATRGSALALRQVHVVADRLGIEVEIVVVSTRGDRSPHAPLATIAGQGAFTGEVRVALTEGAADLAVHSAKDLPAADDDRFQTVFLDRTDPRDALVGSSIAELPVGATVGTGASRRRAQLTHLRPDLRLVDLRGNIGTRLAKGRALDAIVVAAAALERLDVVPDVPVQFLPVEEFIPQVGQGALAVDALAGVRGRAHELLASLHDHSTQTAVTAERSFLATLGGDCDLPAGAFATLAPCGAVKILAILACGDGRLLKHHAMAPEPRLAGVLAAHALLSELVARDEDPRTT